MSITEQFNETNGNKSRYRQPTSHESQCSKKNEFNQTLNDNDIPPSHIMQISGHRNIQSINNYRHVSQDQQKTMSRILSSSSSAEATTENITRKRQLSLTCTLIKAKQRRVAMIRKKRMNQCLQAFSLEW